MKGCYDTSQIFKTVERNGKIMKKKWIIGTVCLIGIIGIIGSKMLKKEPYAQAVALPVMEAELPETGDIRLTTSVIGRIEPSDVVYVYPKASGDVTAVNIKAGEVVKKGQVLCTIDTKQVETAKNALDSAALTLRQAQEELSRQQLLYNNGGISQQEYSQYQNNVSSAQIAYNEAQYTYETQWEYSQITAPMDGLVEICGVENYDSVSQTDLIFVISGQGNREVSFSATERICSYLKEGDIVEVEKDGTAYEGTVYEISTMADDTTGLYKVKASVDQGAQLSTGSEVKVYVTSEKTENAMTIPVDSVYYENGEPYVYIYQDGCVYQKFIESGIYDSEKIEVLSGISQSDMVVTTWSSELYDGAQVRLKEEMQ